MQPLRPCPKPPERITGYQPAGDLELSNPPRGGSGVPAALPPVESRVVCAYCGRPNHAQREVCAGCGAPLAIEFKAEPVRSHRCPPLPPPAPDVTYTVWK